MFNNVAVIPPTESVGSLGDEILLKGLVDSNDNRETSYTLLLHQSTPKSWLFLNDYSYKFDSLTKIKNDYDIVFGIGADCIDGKYSTLFLEKIEFLNKNKPNIPIRIISCSYNKNPTIDSINIIKLLDSNVTFYFRDKYSKERFDLIFNKKTFLMADLGFTLKRTPKKILEINKNTILLNLNNMNKNGSEYLNQYLNIFKNKNVCLLQHDFRGGHDEEQLLNKLNNEIENSIFIKNSDVNELKNLYSEIKYGVSARLHICIMSLSSGTPIIGIDYQDKMNGVFSDFDVEDLVCTNNSLLEEINEKLNNNLSDYTYKIQKNINKVLNKTKIIWEE